MRLEKASLLCGGLSLLFILAIPSLGSASERVMQVQCEMPSITTINRFASLGELRVNENNEVAGEMGLQATLSGSNDTYDMGSEKLKGTIQVIPAGQLYVDEITILQLSADEEGLMNYRLVLGSKAEAVSSLLVDGTIYKANCSIK